MKRSFLLLAFSAVILFAACDPKEEPVKDNPYLTLDKSSEVFQTEGGSTILSIRSNASWTVSSNASWVTVSPSSGQGNATVTLTAKPNGSSELMTATITVKCGSITKEVSVSQAAGKPAGPVFDVSSDPVDIEYSDVERVIPVNTNLAIKVSVSSDGDWLQGTYDAGKGGVLLVATVNSLDPRTAEVTISASEGSFAPVKVKVAQGSHPDREGILDWLSAMGYGSEDFSSFPTDWKYPQVAEVLAYPSGSPKGKGWKKEGDVIKKEGTLGLSIVRGRVAALCFAGAGPLPESVSQMDALQMLEIFGSDVTGEFPENIASMSYVTYLEIVGTSMTGTIPDLSGMESLQAIRIEDNHGLTGEVLSSLEHCSGLSRIILKDNAFSGGIPPSFGNMQNLERLSLRNYDNIYGVEKRPLFSGDLPSELANCKKLTYIDLSYNDFTGMIPASWVDGTVDRDINLGSNHLSGYLPEGFFTMPQALKNFWQSCFQRDDYMIDVGNLESVPTQYPTIVVNDLDGNDFKYDDVFAANKYTLELCWASWCPFSSQLMPRIKEFYEKYHSAGFEIIALNPGDSRNSPNGTYEGTNDFTRPYVKDKGYDKWYNLYVSYSNVPYYPPIVPAATIYDSKGNMVFSWMPFSDTGHDRFNKSAYSNLMDALFELFGNTIIDSDYNSTDFSADGMVKTLQKASVGNGIDIVIMGDAFSDRQIADGTFGNWASKVVDILFSEEPFKSFRNRFNVYTVDVVSPVEGYSRDGRVLNTYFTGTTRVGGDKSAVVKYARNAVSDSRMDNTLVIVLMNKDTYAGTCYLESYGSKDYGEGLAIAYFPVNDIDDTFRGMVLHEAGGHGFAKLGDEYSNQGSGTIQSDAVNSARSSQRLGWYKNVDFTSDPSQVIWSGFMSDPLYVGDALGCFEGAFTYEYGAYRPTDTSIMRFNNDGFNAPSREAIWYRIGKLSNGDSWDGSHADFVEYDAINRKASTRANHVEIAPEFEPAGAKGHLAPPVIVKGNWRDSVVHF